MRISLTRALRSPAGLVGCLLAALLFDAAAAHAQGGTITGRVTEGQSGRPMPTAAITVEGTRLETFADADGRYRLANVPAGTHTVIARHIGFSASRRSVTVTASGSVSADFGLQPAPIELERVVVTGSSQGAKLKTIGHSVATIDAAKVMQVAPAPSFTSLLLARAPGLRIGQITGRLGATPSISIRGSSGALIYIDGVRVNSSRGQGAVGGGLGAQGSDVAGRLDDINPEDIESIEIIKGPAAATIYGTQAMNGVIQIITKKGTQGEAPRFDLRSTYGSIFFRDADSRMPTNYMRDPSGNIVAWNAIEQEKARGTPLFRTGEQKGLHASVSGGRDQFRYYASSAFDESTGVEPNNYGRQFSLHTNLNVAVSSKVNVASSINFVELDNHLGTDTGLSAMLGAMYGHILLQPNRRGFGLGYPPEISWELYDNSAKVSRFTTSGTVDYNMTSWLRHRLLIGVDHTSGDHRQLERFADPELAQYLTPTGARGQVGQVLRLNKNVTLDYSGNSNVVITPQLSSFTSGGLQVMRVQSTTSSLGGQGFPAPGIESVSSTAVKYNSTQTDVLNTTLGAYLQQKFGWNDRLFGTVALRVDNNSAFGDELQWVTYPKADATWVISEEPFFPWSKQINTLRLRAAYGESGQAPQAFQALRTFSPVQGPGGSNAVTPGAQGNPNLKPERGKEWEAGFETSLFDRLGLDFTYWSKKQVDLIENEGVAPSSGFPGSIPLNLGRVDASGFEFRADLQAVRRSNIEWRIDANISADQSFNVDLGDVVGNTTDAGVAVRADFPTGAVFTKRVVAANYDPVTRRAINVLCDGGPDNNHTPMACAQAPTVHIGQSRPKYSGAIGNMLTIQRRLRLYALVDFKSGHLRFNTDDALRCTGAIGAGVCDINVNPDKYSPLLLAETAATSQGLTEHYWDNAAFAKLREVSVNYLVPERYIPIANRASVTLTGRELATWTGFGGLDPENTAQSVLPPLSRITLTLNLGF